MQIHLRYNPRVKAINRLSLRDRLYLRWQALNFYFRYRIGKFIAGCIERARRYDEDKARLTYERLPAGVLAEIKSLQVEQVDGRSKFLTETFKIKSLDQENSDYAAAAREIVAILKARPEIKSIVHVGARVDVVSAFLAPMFPNVTFTSVDVQDNLEKHNCDLPKSPNWKRKPGYIVDLLERGEVVPDLILTIFTVCKMTPKEFSRFVSLCKGTEAFVILETWKPPLMPGDTANYLSYGQLGDATLPGFLFVHDYGNILNRNGFAIQKNEITRQPFPIRHGGRQFVVGVR